MKSFAHLDYLHLEVSKERIMKYFVADKGTQSEDNKFSEITTEHCDPSQDTNLVRQAPKRPPPPKLTRHLEKHNSETRFGKKTGSDKMIKITREMKMKKKFNTFKENTTKFTKTMYKRISKKTNKSHSVSQDMSSNNPSLRQSTVYIDDQPRLVSTPSSEIHIRVKHVDPVERSRSLNHKSAPPTIVKTVCSIISLEDIVSNSESILLKFPIMPLVADFLELESVESEISNFQQYVDSCLNAFLSSCHRQIKDTISDVNENFSHYLDLDSVSLLCNQPAIYTVHCIPGWKQIRIIEDNKTKDKFIALKNSYSQTWILLNNKETIINKRWLCFPIHAINTLENEISLTKEDDFQRHLLKIFILTCISNVYDDDKFPKNIDPNTILLVSSKCGIIVVFRECLNESELHSLELIECDSIENIPGLLIKSKSDFQQVIARFFARAEVISVLISSTWPLDYLAVLLAELAIDDNE